MTDNVAFGTAKAEPGKAGLQAKVESSKGEREADAAAAINKPTDPEWEEMRRAREAYEARKNPENAAEPSNLAKAAQPSETTKPTPLAGVYARVLIQI